MREPAANTGPRRVQGTEGYAGTAAVVAERFERITFDDVHASVRHLIPAPPSDVATLLRPGGVVLFSVRHGPVPPGRVMFEVPTEETIDLAAASGLRLLLRLDDQPGAYGDTDVTWTKLVFIEG